MLAHISAKKRIRIREFTKYNYLINLSGLTTQQMKIFICTLIILFSITSHIYSQILNNLQFEEYSKKKREEIKSQNIKSVTIWKDYPWRNEPELEGFTYYDKYGYIIKEKRYHGNYFYKTFYPMDYFEEGWIAYSDSIFYVYDSLYRIDTIIAYDFNNEGYDKSSIRIYYYDCYSRLSLINNYYRNEYYSTISFFYDKRNLIVKTIMHYLNTGQTVINEYSYDKKKRIKSSAGSQSRKAAVEKVIHQVAIHKYLAFFGSATPYKQTFCFTHLLGSRKGF